MRDRQDLKLLCGYLIDDAVWEATEDIAPPRAAKYCTKGWIGQEETGRPFKLGHKSETEFSIRLKGIERSGVM